MNTNTNTNKSFSLEELKHICAGDEKFVSEMIRIFIRSTEDGLIGIENAMMNKNFTSISRRAHKIASPCLHMGASSLHEILKKIELEANDSPDENRLQGLVNEARQLANDVILELKNELEKLT